MDVGNSVMKLIEFMNLTRSFPMDLKVQTRRRHSIRSRSNHSRNIHSNRKQIHSLMEVGYQIYINQVAMWENPEVYFERPPSKLRKL